MRKPDWLKMKLPSGEGYRAVRRALDAGGLHTVCESASCPNQGECWADGTATFMILGDVCTRGCRFCAVTRGAPGGAVDADEPARVADAVRQMVLRYAVVTSVTRDDLEDGGASVFAETVRAIKALPSGPLAEVLTPDYVDGPLDTVLAAGPDVFAHNVEVVERLTARMRHGRFDYRRSLESLRQARARGADGLLTKSSVLLGLGETDEEITTTMRDLRAVGVDVLVLGQYLQPTRRHAEVAEFVPPERFDALADRGRELGFGYVASGPLVRTSYKAAEAYVLHRAGREPR
jgi:lipoic acid synthetase